MPKQLLQSLQGNPDASAIGNGRKFAAPVLRESEAKVKPLELFFDLVFVLAITQCTALMADDLSWTGIVRGVAVLAVLWWVWVGYAWLTSVVDPEEGATKIAFFAAIAATLVASIALPNVFKGEAAEFAAAVAVVRALQLLLFWLASKDNPNLRRSIAGLALSTTVGIGLLTAALLTNGTVSVVLWVVALTIDIGGPFLWGSEGWSLVADHFAERHGLILLIAIGESIVAIGSAAGGSASVETVVLAVLGIAICSAVWWLYFDMTARAVNKKFEEMAPGVEQNEFGRDMFSYLHFPMVAGVVLLALGLKKSFLGMNDPLKEVAAFGLYGGVAIYLLAHVAYRYRAIHKLAHGRLVAAIALLAIFPFSKELSALVSIIIVLTILIALISYEYLALREARERIRHGELRL